MRRLCVTKTSSAFYLILLFCYSSFLIGSTEVSSFVPSLTTTKTRRCKTTTTTTTKTPWILHASSPIVSPPPPPPSKEKASSSKQSDDDDDRLRRSSFLSQPLPPKGEPAGVGSLFSLRRTLRSSGARKTIRLWIRRWFKIDTTKRQRRRGGIIDEIGIQERLDAVTDDQLEESKRQIQEKISWAIVSLEEEHALAMMKCLLKDSFDTIRQKSTKQQQQKQHSGIIDDPITLYPDVYGDLRLLRFLRKDERLDPISAYKRYQNFLFWRMENDVDNAIRKDVELRPYKPPSDCAWVEEYMPNDMQLMDKLIGIEKYDEQQQHRQGRPKGDNDVMVPILLNVGAWDTNGVANSVQQHEQGQKTIDQFLKYWSYQYESLHLTLYNQTLHHNRLIHVDEIAILSNITLSQITHPKFVSDILKPWLHLTQSYYPETLKRIVFWDPPNVIYLIWNIVTPLVSKGTVRKVKFVRDYEKKGDDWLDFVREEHGLGVVGVGVEGKVEKGREEIGQ